MLRKMYGPVVEQGVWRIRIKQELWELYNDVDISSRHSDDVCLCTPYGI
jgi:hypothetical protein